MDSNSVNAAGAVCCRSTSLTEDALFFEASVSTSLGEARVYDAVVLRDGKVTHHLTGIK
jgi:hypothetical protein